MEKTMKKLNDSLIQIGDAKMMMMALINHSLQSKMDCSEDIVSTIMDETLPELTPDELSACAERLNVSLRNYKDAKRDCTNKNQKYKKLMTLVTSEIAKEHKLLSLIVKDVSETYDTSCLATSELQDICCWLIVKAVLYKLPAAESLVAASSYKKRKPREKQQPEKETENSTTTEKNEISVVSPSGYNPNVTAEALINTLLGTLMDENHTDLPHRIMREVVLDFSDEDKAAFVNRLSGAIYEFSHIEGDCTEDNKLNSIIHLVESNIGREKTILEKIMLDISDMYDTSEIDIKTMSDISIWLVVKQLLSNADKSALSEKSEVVEKKVQPQKETIKKKPVKLQANVKNRIAPCKNLNMFQVKDLREAISSGDFCAVTMHSIFG